MKGWRILLVSLAVSLGVYFFLTWPLGACFHEGVPSSNRPEAGGARYMVPGDHLQFLYQLWELADSFTGQTPLFYHVYEFNQGNDQSLYNPGSYYFPFGLVFAAGHWLGGSVVGWNLMLCLTVWLIYLTTWLLVRRFSASWLTAAVASLPSILLPYFHVSLLGGSPTGLGMLWVPLVFLGVDVAIRDRRLWGGVLAGVVLAIASWVDLHVFFFLFLATPVWGVMCLAFGAGKDQDLARAGGALRKSPVENLVSSSWNGTAPHAGHSRKRRHTAHAEVAGEPAPRAGIFKPILPLLIGMVLAFLQTGIIRSSLDHTLQSGGRSLKESLGYALRWPGWFDTTLDNRFNIIYLGVWVAAVLAVGFAFMASDAIRRKPRALVKFALLVMVLAAIGGIAVLALGPNTPFDREHRFWALLRTVIPPYKMIRQPAKIYCLLTPFLGVALALVMDRLNRLSPRSVWSLALALAIAAGCVYDYGRRLDPTICLLDYEQGGYRAVAEDAAACGRENRAMAIPLWPGDSHWNSITEYYATLHRTKMLNGYSPSVSRQYFSEVFQRFEGINMGAVTDPILDGLLAMKIGYLILHEDAFPQKVSPFAVSQTRRALMAHPRLKFLANDKAVWAFKILDAGSGERGSDAAGLPDPLPVLSAWQWDACDMAGGSATVEKDGTNVFMRLADNQATLRLDPRALYPVEGLRFVASVCGRGSLAGSFGTGLTNDEFAIEVANGNEWGWVEIPAPELPPGKMTLLNLAFTNTGGRVDISMLTMLAGPWKWLQPGESLVIPAEAFCITGYSDTNGSGIHLDRDRTQASVAFYAPVVPVTPGWYCVTLDYTTSSHGNGVGAAASPEVAPAPAEPETPVLGRAGAGVQLGEFSVLRSDGQNRMTLPLIAGREFALNYRLESPRPLRFEFRYSRAADLLIRSVTLTRVE